MQPKLQTILFFTFLICVQISITNSLKIKSKIQSQSKVQITDNMPTAPAPVAAPVAAPATAPAPAPATAPAPAPIPTNAPLPATPSAPVAAPATPLANNATITPPANNATANPTKDGRKKFAQKRHHQKKKHHHHHHDDRYVTDVRTFNKDDVQDESSDDHTKQYIIHHEVPRNLTSLNNKVRDRFDTAHRRLDEINELKKENAERKVISKLPTKPDGIDAIGILNFKLRHVSKHSQNFNITSVADFEYAYNKARYLKTATVTVNKRTYKIKQIGTNFWYGAIVGHGGIGLYSHKFGGDYVLAVTHNQDMSLFDFARYFQHLKHQFERHVDQLRTIYVKDHDQMRTDNMKARLRHDKHLYDAKNE